MTSLAGVLPVLPMPFNRDETIDEMSFRRTAEFVASSEVTGMCLPAYYSEFYKLTEAEPEWSVATALEVAAGRTSFTARGDVPP